MRSLPGLQWDCYKLCRLVTYFTIVLRLIRSVKSPYAQAPVTRMYRIKQGGGLSKEPIDTVKPSNMETPDSIWPSLARSFHIRIYH